MPPVAKGRSAERRQGGGRGFLIALVAIAVLAGAGFAVRGMLPSVTNAEEAAAPDADAALASTANAASAAKGKSGRPDAEAAASTSGASAGAPDAGLTPPPRAEAFTLDSVGVTETAASSRSARDRRVASNSGARAPQPQAPVPNQWPPRSTGADPNAAYVPPPSASLPAAEQPAVVQPATVATVTPAPQPSTAAAADSPVREPAKVRWQSRPSASRLDQVYPQRARQGDVEGLASLRCTILPDLRAACSVLSETPAGYGFGAAALKASESLRASPVLDDGSNVTGAVADVAIRFKVQ
jgi:protein TonB